MCVCVGGTGEEGVAEQQLEVRREPEVTHRRMRRLAFQTQNKKQIEEAAAPPPCNLKQMLFSEVEADVASEGASERGNEWHADGGRR